MEITTRLDGEEMHVVLRGRLDAAWSESVHKTLQNTLHSGCHHIALDLAQVEYLSSAGIRVLLLLMKNLNNIGGTLRLIDSSPQVSAILKLVEFDHLLQTFSKTERTAKVSDSSGTARKWQHNDAVFDVFDLHPNAVQQGRIIGSKGDITSEPTAVQIHSGIWVIGQGSLGTFSGQIGQAGELLAIDGLALSLPGDDPTHPDWLLREGNLQPEIALFHGLKGQGNFRHLLRFGIAPDSPPLQMSELAHAALELCGSNCVALAVVAETARLVGAARQIPFYGGDDDFFAFPTLRDRLLFTAEPSYADETCLIVGVAVRTPSGAITEQVRPWAKGSELHMHLHAAVVPFNPVHKGLIDLHGSLQKLIDNQTVRGLLHLLNDDRDGVGGGESMLRRGALWCAPLEFTEGSA